MAEFNQIWNELMKGQLPKDIVNPKKNYVMMSI